ncbi:MAG TPA: beta-galactosidase [Kineosporiaceae bacterium]|nr:beta-galactosidase [Kineosporiaceae bacterium]
MSIDPPASPPPATGRRRWPVPGIALGGDYNPEQWPQEVWAEDLRLMREAGVTFATVGVFSWALLEPQEGRYEFGWLDQVMDLLAEGDIAADLATATASPPPWLSRAYPQTLPVDRAGNRLWPGGRQAWCPSSPVFREKALTLVGQLATRYAGHPALKMWHVSNELGCHNVHCYCDVSAAAFRRWLMDRYGSLAAVNDAWGTTFWSQRYGDVEEIWPPRQVTAIANPTQQLDFARFSSDELLDYYRAERDVLRTITPDVPVTTNFMVMSHVRGMDYWSWAPELDVVSTDHYLDGRLADPAHELSWAGDLTRGLAGGGPWWLMEHSTSAVNWQPVNYAKVPGQLLRNSLAHVARGADAVGFFQWRAAKAGAEKFHSALLPHAGTDTKVFREVSRLGQVLKRAADVAGTRVEAQAGFLFDWNAWWATDLDSHPSELVRYGDQALATHRALWSHGITLDGIRPGADLSRYKLVIVPTLYLVDEATVASLRAFVEGGGRLVVTYFSGIVDEFDHIRPGGYPGAFADLLGIRTEEFFPLAAGQTVRLAGESADGLVDAGSPVPHSGATGTVWTELTHLTGARAVARYLDGPTAGHPAVTVREVGAGEAWYLGTSVDEATLSGLLGAIAARAGVAPAVPVPPGVEVTRRSGDGRSFLFVLNHTGEQVTVPAQGFDLVSETACQGRLTLPAGGCAVVREQG